MMNKQTTYIVVAVVVVIIVIGGIGAYLLLNKPATGGNGGTPTPTPVSTPTAAPGNNVATATSLQYNVDVVVNGTTSTFVYKAKNLGTENVMLRVDMTVEGQQYSYVLNAAQQKSWVSMGGTWVESSFATDWPTYSQQLTDYSNELADWSGTGDFTYTSPTGDSVRIYGIVVNPTLADSLFQAS